MRVGGQPSWTVCGPSHKASAIATLPPSVGRLRAVRIMQGRGPRSLRSGLRPDPGPAGTEHLDASGPSEPFAGFRSTTSQTVSQHPNRFQNVRSVTCRSLCLGRGGLTGASRHLHWLPIVAKSQRPLFELRLAPLLGNSHLACHWHCDAALQGAQGRVSPLRESWDTTTPGCKLVCHAFGAVAKFERDVHRGRKRAGLRGREGVWSDKA